MREVVRLMGVCNTSAHDEGHDHRCGQRRVHPEHPRRPLLLRRAARDARDRPARHRRRTTRRTPRGRLANWSSGPTPGTRSSAHADRAPAFDGADYLINEIQVGGYRATVTDFEIPTRYGVRQTIADTIGIGGIMRGLRTIPVMIEMADDIARLSSPDALLLNYTNPMAMVPWGIWAGSSLPAERVDRRVPLGARHAFVPRRDRGGRRSRRPLRDGGLQPPVLRVHVRGPTHRRGSLPAACARSSTPTPRGWDDACASSCSAASATSPPSPREHSSEYVPWFLHLDDQVERFRCEIDEYIRRSDENLEEFAEIKRALDAGEELAGRAQRRTRVPDRARDRDGHRTRGLHQHPQRRPHRRAARRCVRRGARRRSGADGVRPQRVGALPPQCLALNRTFLNVVELTVRAVLEGRRDLVVRGGAAGPQHRRHPHHAADRRDGRRPHRRPRRPDPRGDPARLRLSELLPPDRQRIDEVDARRPRGRSTHRGRHHHDRRSPSTGTATARPRRSRPSRCRARPPPRRASSPRLRAPPSGRVRCRCLARPTPRRGRSRRGSPRNSQSSSVARPTGRAQADRPAGSPSAQAISCTNPPSA